MPGLDMADDGCRSALALLAAADVPTAVVVVATDCVAVEDAVTAD